jgi:uncharacterized protein YuzE
MANLSYAPYLNLLEQVKQNFSLRYDAEGDVLYVNFAEGQVADDSELTEDDVIIRYDAGGQIIGYTILHAQKR